MKYRLLSLLIAATLLSSSLPSCSEVENAGVEVIITDQHNRAVPNAKVTFYTQPGTLLKEAEGFTNEFGKFEASFNFIAVLTIFVQVDNYQNQRLTGQTEVTLIRGKTQEIPIQVLPVTNNEV